MITSLPLISCVSPLAAQMFVRLFVDENLDRMVPISKQPKEKIQAIIESCSRQFPEFQERARKRIRTYLKSCRRLKKTGFEVSSNKSWRHTHTITLAYRQIPLEHIYSFVPLYLKFSLLFQSKTDYRKHCFLIDVHIWEAHYCPLVAFLSGPLEYFMCLWSGSEQRLNTHTRDRVCVRGWGGEGLLF